jgi:hypothetical protein
MVLTASVISQDRQRCGGKLAVSLLGPGAMRVQSLFGCGGKYCPVFSFLSPRPKLHRAPAVHARPGTISSPPADNGRDTTDMTAGYILMVRSRGDLCFFCETRSLCDSTQSRESGAKYRLPYDNAMQRTKGKVVPHSRMQPFHSYDVLRVGSSTLLALAVESRLANGDSRHTTFVN